MTRIPDDGGLRRHGRALVTLGVPILIIAILLARFSLDARSSEPGARVTLLDSLEVVGTVKGPASGESGWDLFIDDEGNFYTAGHHGGLDTNGDGTVDLPADGIDPMFTKSAPDGSITWLFSPTAPGFDDARSIASDRAGGLYAVGYVKNGTFRIEPSITLRSTGTWDAYLLRLGANGRSIWVRTTSGDSIESFSDVASDADGNAYVTGMGYRSFGLEGHSSRIDAGTGLAQFVASYDPDGTLRWVRSWPDARGWRFHEVAIGRSGEVWVAGSHGEAGVDLDADGQPELEGRGGFNVFLARLDPDGVLEDAWQVVSLDGERGRVEVAEIVFTDDGDVVIGGTVVGSVDFDGDGRADARSYDGTPSSGYLARYSPEGELRWARAHVIDRVWDVATDGRRFALAGFYEGDRDLNQDGTIDEADGLRDTSGDEDPSSDLLVLVVSEEGRLERHINAPGIGGDQARAVAFLPRRSAIWVTGFFKLGADFDGTLRDGQAYIRCDALGDIFWARYGLIEEPGIVLTADPWKDGPRRRGDLQWTGAATTRIEVYRDGTPVTSTMNDGVHRDTLPANATGSFQYRVCEIGTGRCSNPVTITF